MVGSEKVKNMFKKKFPSLSSLGSDGNTSFLRAARAGHLDKVLEHLRNNVDINTSNTNGLNALHLASKDGHINVVTELLKRGASVDSATKKGNTALHIASLAGQEDVVRLLVEHGASVNVQSQNGFTPLYMAAQESHDNVVKYLLANGANQSLATEDGFTPLAVAMQQGHDKVVAVLLENDTRGKVRLPALHIAAKKDDCKAAALLLQNEHNPDVTSKSGFTPLHIASHYGNEGIANLLLNKGADVNYSAKHNITPLHVAAKWGKSNMVSLLLEKGANIESRTRDGLTPLHCAARSGHEQVVDMLLERGAPISSKTKNGLAPLHMSSQGDHVDAARILLYHRAPVDEVTVDYLTALHVAAHCGHARVAKLLLDRKADPNARALNGFTPLHIACKKNRIKVVELLLKHGASIEATTESGLTPLHVASFMGCMNIVIYLLQNEANPDVPTVRGETPLHLAARANQTDIIRILLRNGAQVDARAREQQTPLHIAARLGNVDIVMLLLQHGAAADCTTKDLYSALHIAAKEGQDEVAAVLLENGASPTATTKKGFTPLHLAAKYGNMKVARLLLQRDAPVDAQGKNGVTPLHVASHYDHQNVALLLLDKGASPHATAKNGHTPLHIAAKKNQMDIATTLLEYGAKASAESKAGFTPLHLSAQEGHTDMSCLLLDHHADTNHKAKNGLTPLHLCAQEDRVNVASVLVKNGAEINTTTKAGYTPLHVACHFGQLAMVKFLLEEGGDVAASTAVGYTPLHQAAQQGHCAAVNCLLERGAPPNATTNQGQTAMSIAQKLGYISVVETLKGVTEPITITPTTTDEKYKVVSPETMQETFMSDSEDEGGEDTLLSEQPYRYLTVDEMKSLGDDSLPIDVRQDERQDSNRECMTVPPTAVDDTISPQHLKEAYSQFTTPDNIDIARHPLHVGFLVSFLVDARGGAMRGCRHSGVRVIVPPRRASMPVRVTCRYLKRDKLSHPPPLMEGEALASRILELGPVGAKFLGPVMIEVPHFGSLRGKEREIVILRSDNGETWREHTVDCSEEAVQDVLSHSFDKEADLSQLEESSRTTRILTTDFPHYFAVVTRVRQEVHAIGPEGGMVSSSVVPQVQAVFPQGALTKKIKVGLQAQPISAELAAKLLGNRVAVSPIVTVEPRRRKFHKPITLTIPKPQAANKGMINQYSGDAPTLRLLCSITGGTTRAQWEDVTGSTPFTFVNDCVSFTTTVSARFWLMDCRNVGDATKMATELYREAIHVPFMAKFVVFAKRVDPLEARLRIFCMTDDKEDKTLEHQEHFTEVAKSRDVEVLEGKTQYVEFAGNLVPVTKSGEQLQLGFRAFRENRLPFTVRVKDPHADSVGRTLFMREARLPKGEPPQQPICVLNIVLPEEIIPEALLAEHELHKYSFIQDSSGLESYQRVDLRLSDISNLLGEDWPRLAEQLEVAPSHINRLKSEQPHSVAQQGLAMLRFWLSEAGNKAQASTLETALSRIGRDDIVQQCVFNVDQSELQLLKDDSRDASIRRSIPYSDKDIMKDSESVEDLSRTSPKKGGDFVEKDDKEERKYEAEEKEVEEIKKSVSERRKEIEKRLSLDKPIEKKSETIIDKVPVEKGEDLSEKEIAEEKRVSSPEDEPSELSFEQKRLSFEQGKRVIEMKPDSTTMKEVKERADERLIAEERRLAEAQKENKSLVDESSIPFHEKRKSFEKGVKEDKSKEKDDAAKKEDLRRDSALFEGVSQGLIHLDAAFTAAPQVQDLLSPKVSKTPPPSPAEFKDITGTVAWTEDSPAVIPSKPDQSLDWAEKGRPDSAIDISQQGLARNGVREEIKVESGKEQSHISVTSKTPQQITETIDIKTTENKIAKDLEKEGKYQFTMSVPDKKTYEDTLNSITEFLETEKNYTDQQYKLFDKSAATFEADVTSSDDTDGSQSKSESDTKSDKSFMGKMSKKLFGVFKKDDKEKSEKKNGRNKKHKKGKAGHDEISIKESKDTNESEKHVPTTNSKILPENESIITIPKNIVEKTEGEQFKADDVISNLKKTTINGDSKDTSTTGLLLHEESPQVGENQMQNVNEGVVFEVSTERIKQEIKELTISDPINFLSKESKIDISENIAVDNFKFTNKPEDKCEVSDYSLEGSNNVEFEVSKKEEGKGNVFVTVNTVKKDSKENITGETISDSQKTTTGNSGNTNKGVSKNIKQGVILDVKALSDKLEDNYIDSKNKVIDVTESTYESGKQVTITVTDKVLEDVGDASKKAVEQVKSNKDKSKSFFSGIFSKGKEEEKGNGADIVSVNSTNQEIKKELKEAEIPSNKLKNTVQQDSAIKETEISNVNVCSALQPSLSSEPQTTSFDATKSEEKSKKGKEKGKSFFGSIFGKGENISDDEKRTLGDTTFFIPENSKVIGIDENNFENKNKNNTEIADRNLTVKKDPELAENNIISPHESSGDGYSLESSKIIAEDYLTLNANIQDASDEILDSTKTNFDKTVKLASKTFNTTKEKEKCVIGDMFREADNILLTTSSNENYAKAFDSDEVQKCKPDPLIDHSSNTPSNDKAVLLDNTDRIEPITNQANDINKTLTTILQDKTHKVDEIEKEINADIDTILDSNKIKVIENTSLLTEKPKPILKAEDCKHSEMGSTKIESVEKESDFNTNDITQKVNDIKDKAIAVTTNLSEKVNNLQKKDLGNICDPLKMNEFPKEINVKLTDIDGTNETEQILNTEKSTSFEINTTIQPFTLDSSNVIEKEEAGDNLLTKIECLGEFGTNELKDTNVAISESSKSIKEKSVTFSDSIIKHAENIANENKPVVAETVNKIKQESSAVTEDTIKTSEGILSQSKISTSEFLKGSIGDSKKKIAPALENITKITKGIIDSGKSTISNVDSSLEKRAVELKDKTSETISNIKTDIVYDGVGKDKIISDLKGTVVESLDEIAQSERKCNVSSPDILVEAKDEKTKDYINMSSDIKSDIDNDIGEIQESLVSSLNDSKEMFKFEPNDKSINKRAISVKSTSLGTEDTLMDILSNDDYGSQSSGKEPDKVAPLKYPPSTDIYHSDKISDNITLEKDPKQNLEKDKSSNEIPDSTSTNDDKLNNILIDMLIEQECMKSLLPDISSQMTIETDQTVLQGSSLPEKHDTEDNEKLLKNVSSPFKTVASFGEVESLINEEELKRASAHDSAEHSSYVTTPTMQRRKIGGSQRLSREERPDLREVSHIQDYYSSDEDETNNYIVTEPSERSSQRTVTFQVESEDEAYLQESDSSSELDIEVTEMTPSPDPTSKKHSQVTVEEDNQANVMFTSDKNTQRIERRFERMASETLEADPAVKFTTDREFQRMVSQLSNEEVDACLSQWDEGGLTPSEELDSTKDTIEGDLDPELEALPEAFLGTSKPLYSPRTEWDNFEHNLTNTPESVFWAFDSTPTSAVIQPNELDIPVQSVQVKGESAGEEVKKSPIQPTTREGEESLLDLAAGLKDKKESGAGSGPSSAK